MHFDDLSKADNSAAELELLAQLLKDEGIEFPPAQTIPPRSGNDNLLLSFAQQRLWFLDQFEPDTFTYNITQVFIIKGPLEVALLEQSLNQIIQRHEILRTTFIAVDGVPQQIIAPAFTLSLPLVDLTGLDRAQQEAEAQRQILKESRWVFDLTQGPLIRALLLWLAPEEYILILNLHHIIADGWSMAVLFKELSVMYDAVAKDEALPPPLPIQYADYAVWQRECMQDEAFQNQLAYWRKQLAGYPSILNLPTDRPRPKFQSDHGARQSMVLSSALTATLKTVSQEEDATLFMTLLAAFNVLLYRYSGQEDILVGAPIANRNQSTLENLIGLFANTLALRTDLSGQPTFRELLARVRQTALTAYEHQDLPFEKLVEELQPERNVSYSPLFQVMLVLQNTPPLTLEFSGLKLTPQAVDNGTTKFDLTLSMTERPAGLKTTWEYNTDLFDATTIERMMGHFQVLLQGIVTNPTTPISRLPLLTEVERRQLLVEWNNTGVAYPQTQCIHQLVEAQAHHRPEAVALVFEEQRLTYGELNARANQLAHTLKKHGVGPETLVGICIERSLEMVIGLLGILKAGGAYLPLDPDYPPERLAFMLDDAQSSIMLTLSTASVDVPDTNVQTIYLDTAWQKISSQSTEFPSTQSRPENLAYVIYTSGSTGKPKGTRITHQNVVRLVKGATYAQLTADQVFLQLAPISFDASTFEIWGSLVNGAQLVIFPPHKPTLAQLGQIMRQHHVTTLWLTAGLFHLMVDTHLEELKHLHQLLAGGDVLSVAHVKKALNQLPGVRLINGYGPTENTTFSCCYAMDPDAQLAPSVPIGRPISNTRAYILDSERQPVPIGVPGELYLGGDGLARDYLNRPALTAEKFIPNPFSQTPGARLYRTGDLARYLPDGNIEFLGRLDQQVKIRGFRIELGEIEAVLSRHPAVQDCVVVSKLREGQATDKQLVAYVTSGHDLAPNELRRFLKSKLPDYMLPSVFVILESLPLDPNGKVDRSALPPPVSTRTEDAAEFVPPKDPLELELVKVWEKVLGLQPIGLTDNFFDLGGHSLLAIQMFAEMNKAVTKDVPVSILFQAPTISELTSILRQQHWAPTWTSLVAVQPKGGKPPLFLVPPGGNISLSFAGLARHMEPDQPVYSFDPLGLDENSQPHRRAQDMAAHYVKEMRAFRPNGPYLLGGMCFGFNVAMEMALQLRKQEQQVPLLIGFDPWISYPNVLWLLLRYARGFFHQTYDVGKKWLNAIVNRNQPEQSHRRKVYERHVWLQRRYLAKPSYPGRIAVLQSEEFAFLQSRWAKVAKGGLDYYVFPGTTHSNLLLREPYVTRLAQQLQRWLDRVDLDNP